jgi:hypothetical protein
MNTGRDKESIEPLSRNLDRALLERNQRFEEVRTMRDAELGATTILSITTSSVCLTG